MNVKRTLVIGNVPNYTGNFATSAQLDRPFTSLLVVPVFDVSKKDVCAVLCVDATSIEYFDKDAQFFGECFADVLGVVLARV